MLRPAGRPGPGVDVPVSEDGGEMDEERANRLVKKLRERNVMAHVERPSVFQFGIRVVLPDRRYAVWDGDGTAGLDATVMRNGVLVGFVPTIPGSDAFDDDQVVEAITQADYGRAP